MTMRIEPKLKDCCKDKANNDWLKESIHAYFVVIIICAMNICLCAHLPLQIVNSLKVEFMACLFWCQHSRE